MTVQTQSSNHAGATVIPFRRPMGRRGAARVIPEENLNPGTHWQWAEDNLHRVIELIQGRVNLDGLLGESCRRYLSLGADHPHARIALALAHALDVEIYSALGMAAACDLQHAAAGIRDDLLGWDRIRRAREPIWRLFDERVAVSAGDYLTVLIHGVLASTPCAADQRVELFTVFNRALERILASRVGVLTAGVPPSKLLARYEHVTRDGAGVLLALPAESVLFLAGIPKVHIRRVREAMRAYGLAFRILDEVDQILGSSSVAATGMRPYLDARTAPVLWYLERADAREREQLQRVLMADTRGRHDESMWVEKIQLSSAIQDCRRHAAWAQSNAQGYLKQLPQPLKNCLTYGLEHAIRSDR
jgi:geranylgeranyl pyrophosphate synthase